MNVGTSITLMASALGFYVSALAWRFGRAPGFRDQRWFAVCSLIASVYSLCGAGQTADLPDEWTIVITSIGMGIVSFQAAAWIRYTDQILTDEPPWRGRAMVMVALGILMLVPGMAFEPPVNVRHVPWVGATYHDPTATTLNIAVQLALVVITFLLAIRFYKGWRRGVPQAGLHLVAGLVFMTMGANDVLAFSGVIETPNLVEVAFVGPIALVGYGLTKRFTTGAAALAELRQRLERLVEERTKELERAQEALHRSEKLAVMGRFASAIAHEVNDPASVVAANLNYLSDLIASGADMPRDGEDCLAESQAALERIARSIRQLRDAARLAADPVEAEGAALAPIVAAAVEASSRLGGPASVSVEVGSELRVRAQQGLLSEVVLNLVSNAFQAIPLERSEAQIVIRARAEDGDVWLTVEDDGIGMSEEHLRNVFEPFHSTKRGAGFGLGLGLSRQILRSIGGEISLESTLGRGTRATLRLPDAMSARDARSAEEMHTAA